MLERIFVPEGEMSLFSTSNRLERLQGKVIPIDNNHPINDRISAVKAKGHSQGHATMSWRPTPDGCCSGATSSMYPRCSSPTPT